MKRDVTVRPAEPSDAPALLALRRAITAETRYMLYEPGELNATVDDERERITQARSQCNTTCLVGDIEGELVGYLNAMGEPFHRLRHATTLALGVLRAHWGQGVASALLDEALRWSREAGLVRVELTVHTTNEAAIRLYRRAGFQIEGTRRCSLMIDGQCVDEFLMSIVHDR